jgi:hypothetical protein
VRKVNPQVLDRMQNVQGLRRPMIAQRFGKSESSMHRWVANGKKV